MIGKPRVLRQKVLGWTVGLIVLLAVLLPLWACHAKPQTQGAAGGASSGGTSAQVFTPPADSGAAFDFYLLNLSWSPEFCYSHRDAPECANHSTFVLHGLWPQNNNGSYPEKCSDAAGPANPDAYKDIYPDAGLLQHEWQEHGTCSGLTPDQFFSDARTAFHSVVIPPMLNSLTAQISSSPDEILSSFTAANPSIPRSSLALSCGHNYLTAVEVCLDKSLHPIGCGEVRSCRANSVRIPAP
jgi:ribonuclease T2